MTTLKAIQHSIAPELAELNARIGSKLTSTNPLMNRVVATFLESKGKQIRPVVVMLCARIASGDALKSLRGRVMASAAAVELLHNASLIHDDVVDESKLRRNKPTLNALWDNHIAVLVGDFFVSTALQEAISTADLRIIDAICNLGKMLSLGEIDQIYNASEHSLTEDAYFKIISYKTASLFVACARVGCYAVDADDALTERLARVAELLGQCFQIRDDIFDYYPADKVGKPTGNDLREGKITLPLLYALRTGVGRSEHAAMLAAATSEEIAPDMIPMLQRFAIDCGGIEYAFDTMRRLRGEADEIMASVPQSEATKLFSDLFDYIIAREY